MKKRLVTVTLVICGLIYVYNHFEIDGLSSLRIVPKKERSQSSESRELGWNSQLAGSIYANQSPSHSEDGTTREFNTNIPLSSPLNSLISFSSKSEANQTLASENRGEPRIRIASFNLSSFNESKLHRGPVVETLARIIRHFDLIAVQSIHSRQNDLLPLLIEKVNKSDRRYDYCIGPRVGQGDFKEQFAILFDTDRIETDRDQLYTVDDPQNLMEFEPLVGWFRCKQVSKSEAFTFSIVNLRIAASSVEREVALLPQLFRSVRQDGRAEDDIILTGDFGCSSAKIAGLANWNMSMALEDVATTVSGEAMLDNILFPQRSTDEYTGRSGVIDFLRQLNLTYDQAVQVSTHLPVWAEFSAYEGRGESRHP